MCVLLLDVWQCPCRSLVRSQWQEPESELYEYQPSGMHNLEHKGYSTYLVLSWQQQCNASAAYAFAAEALERSPPCRKEDSRRPAASNLGSLPREVNSPAVYTITAIEGHLRDPAKSLIFKALLARTSRNQAIPLSANECGAASGGAKELEAQALNSCLEFLHGCLCGAYQSAL